MNHIDLIIPTRNRLQKLMRTLASIPQAGAGVPLHLIVVCDGDERTAFALLNNGHALHRVVCVEKHSGAVFCRNLVTAKAKDAVLYATDDIEFEPFAIDRAVEAMRRRFPDDDGIVGFNQVNHEKFSPAGVALVGSRFLARYPGKKLFFPGYFHFACQEIARAGRLLGRLYLCPDARLVHHHPSLFRAEVDNTHVEARRFRRADRKLSNAREAAGLTWGVN
jgi:glycosyltransferase involved in cell wall biosynthesis